MLRAPLKGVLLFISCFRHSDAMKCHVAMRCVAFTLALFSYEEQSCLHSKHLYFECVAILH